MGAAPGAFLGRPAAEQAAAQGCAVQLLTAGGQHVHIKQPPCICAVLQRTGKLFQRRRVRVHHVKPLAAGRFILFRAKYALCPHPAQLFQQQPAAQPEPPPDQRPVFHRTRDVHGKGYQRETVHRQQFPLPRGPAFPGVQHFRQRNLTVHTAYPLL